MRANATLAIESVIDGESTHEKFREHVVTMVRRFYVRCRRMKFSTYSFRRTICWGEAGGTGMMLVQAPGGPGNISACAASDSAELRRFRGVSLSHGSQFDRSQRSRRISSRRVSVRVMPASEMMSRKSARRMDEDVAPLAESDMLARFGSTWSLMNSMR